MPGWVALATLGALVVLAALLAVLLLRSRSRSGRALRDLEAESSSLRARVDDIERRLTAAVSKPAQEWPGDEYVITQLGEDPDPADAVVPTRPAAPLFADLVLRESVVQAASLASGVRRALSPERRNRIRFEMRREVKRARRQRRSEHKEARRQWEARQRAEPDRDDAA